MAGLHDIETIDLVAEQADGSALLVIVKEGRWTPAEDAALLRAKLNTYAQFALDGGLVSHYPQLAGRPVTIRVESPSPLPTDLREVLSVADAKLKPYGIAVIEMVNPRL